MASLQQLTDEICGWINREDIRGLIPGWVLMVETEIAETLRSRCQVKTATQPIDSAYITMPPDFAAMESIRDAVSGELFVLKDQWSGHWTSSYSTTGWTKFDATPNPYAPSWAYRLLEDCIEFLPHPLVPDPPDPNWIPQQVRMGWYAKPQPLILPSDTNPVLEQLYAVYFFGVSKYAAMFAMDDARASQADAAWQQAVTRGNLWKQQSDYSGAPYRAELATTF